jgi:heme/copper-type cytochrome/quinol oxidase subunit 2
MDKRTKICLWVIVIGLVNFLAFTLIYMFIGGEAATGRVVQSADGQLHYLLQTSFEGRDVEVSLGLFLYSGIHSISIWVTVAGIMLAMLTLAKERIISSMHSTVVRGRTFITILATVITLISTIITIWFVLQFVNRISHPSKLPPVETKVTSAAIWSPAEAPAARGLGE